MHKALNVALQKISFRLTIRNVNYNGLQTKDDK